MTRRSHGTLILILMAAVALVAGDLMAKGVTLPPYQKLTLPNGLELLLMEKRDVPLIALHGRIRGGSVADPAGKAGTADLLAELMMKGAGSRDAAEFSEAIESVGGILSTGAGTEALFVRGEFLARDRARMLDLLADLLMRPTLSKDELASVRQREIDSIAAAKDSNPGGLIASYAAARLFGDHPYGRVASEATLAAITHDDVAGYFANHVGADRTVLAFVGDFDAKSFGVELKKRFGSWKKAAEKAPAIAPTKPAEGGTVLLVDKPDATQTWFWIGNLGVARNDPHNVVLDLANTAFGGRFTSMLNTELRVKTGLTYGARSLLGRETQPGPVAISSFTRTDATVEAIDRALAVLAELREKGLDTETLASVKAYVAGQFPPDLETGTQLAAKLTEIEFYDLGKDDVDRYVEQVEAASPEQVESVIARVYPEPGELLFVLIGNAEAIREGIAKYGSVTEMKITEPQFRPRG